MSEHEGRFYDLEEIKSALAGRIDEFVLTLYPNAKREAQGYRIGNIHGEKGDSMLISTRANNAGYFLDFATGDKGKAWRLVSLNKSLSFKEGLQWLANFLNIKPIQSFGSVSKSKDPEKLAKDIRTLSPACIEYAKNRGISEETLLKYGVGTDAQGKIAFPYYDAYGRLGMVKHWGLTLKPDGKKDTWTSSDPIMSLFGKDVCDPDTGIQRLVITEGEWDAMACWEMGIPAVSIPMGCSNTQWITEDYQFLSHYDEIVLLFDNDQAGKKAAKDTAARLGQERCLIVTLPLKDANDMLRAGRGKEIASTIEKTTPEPIAEIVDPTSMKEGVRSYMKGDHLVDGDPFFLPNFDLSFRKHEITLWFGFSFHGKALEINTPIPTPNGLKPILNIHPGDYVYSPEGKAVRVIAESPIFNDHDCYEVLFNDGAKVIADAGHQWTVTTAASRRSIKNNSRSKAKRTRPNYNQEHKRPRPVTVTTEKLANMMDEKPAIDVCDPIREGAGIKSFTIHPYVLGAWLGDGTSNSGQITCHDDDRQIVWEIGKHGYATKKLSSKYLWKLDGLFPQLKAIGLIKDKHIPHGYLVGDYETRLALLQGLMDTDGHISKIDKRCEFCTIKKDLADQVLYLCCSLGIKASLVVGDATIDGRFISKKYRVLFLTTLPVFRLERKLAFIPKKISARATQRRITSITRIETVPTKCISVDSEDHLFLCSPHCIPTHNSVAVANQMASLAAKGKQNCIASFEQPPELTFSQILTQFTAYPNLPYTDDFEPAYDHLSNLVFMYKSMERADPKHLISTFIHAHKRYGVDTFVINNVMTMNIDRGDNTAQAEAIDGLRVFVSKYPVHLHIVAHPRKPPENTSKPPGMAEIRGASEWGDMPHNIITVWRDMAKSERMAEMVDSDFDSADINKFFESTPCGKLIVRKQRTTGETPLTNFWFHKETKRFTSKPAGPMPMYSQCPWK
jgi:hypothetical protein